MVRPWVQVYEQHTEDSGYEHVNPNVIVNCYISGADDDEMINVIATDINGNDFTFNFQTVKEAQRFINRLGDI